MRKSRFLRLVRLGMLSVLGLQSAMGDGPMIPPGAPPVPPAKLDGLADYDAIQNKEAAAFLYNRKLIGAIKTEDGIRFCPKAPADILALCRAIQVLLPAFHLEMSAMSRDEAVAACYAAMQQQGLTLLDESCTFSEFTIPEGGLIAARPGKQVTLTVDGVEMRMESGKTYIGDVRFTVANSYEIVHMFDVYDGRTALCVRNGIEKSVSVLSAIQAGHIAETAAEDLVIESRNDYFNPVVLDGDGHYTLRNPKITMDGHGGDDFAGYGAGIMVTGNKTVVIDGGEINTVGSIRTAIWLGGHCKALIKNLTVNGHDGPTTDFPVAVMNKVPWPLGLAGNLRTTNLLEWANGTYLNCDLACEQWGVLSTDGSWRGSKLTCINTNAAITGKSGYGAYCDMGVEDYFYGTNLTAPDYGLIIGGGFCGATFGPANRKNAAELYEQIPEDRRDAPSIIRAGRHAVIIHSNQGGHCTVEPGTAFYSGCAIFLIKSMPGKEVTTEIRVDRAALHSDSGVILHLMESDDAGNFNAEGWLVPEVKPVKTELDVTDAAAETTLHAYFSHTALQGDFYNSRWAGGQNLCIHAEGCVIDGDITAAVQRHVNYAPGELLKKEQYFEIGNVAVEPVPVVSNGVILVLENGSVWTPKETSYLSSLELGADCAVHGRLTVNGTETPIEPGKHYCGDLMVTPIG